MRHVLLVEARFCRLSRTSSRDEKLGADSDTILGSLQGGRRCLQFGHGDLALWCSARLWRGQRERGRVGMGKWKYPSVHQVGPLIRRKSHFSLKKVDFGSSYSFSLSILSAFGIRTVILCY